MEVTVACVRPRDPGGGYEGENWDVLLTDVPSLSLGNHDGSPGDRNRQDSSSEHVLPSVVLSYTDGIDLGMAACAFIYGLTGADEGGLRGLKAVRLFDYTKQELSHVSRTLLYIVMVPSSDRLLPDYVDSIVQRPRFYPLEKTERLRLTRQTMLCLSGLESFLTGIEADGDRRLVLNTVISRRRLYTAVCNPAYATQQQTIHSLGRKVSQSDRIGKKERNKCTPNEVLAQLLRMEKCESVVLNPIFAASTLLQHVQPLSRQRIIQLLHLSRLEINKILQLLHGVTGGPSTSGNTEASHNLLSRLSPNPDLRHWLLSYPLHYACWLGNISEVKKQLMELINKSNSPDITLERIDGELDLNGNLTGVKKTNKLNIFNLKERGEQQAVIVAVLDQRDSQGWAPIHYAAYSGHPEVVEWLCSATALPVYMGRSVQMEKLGQNLGQEKLGQGKLGQKLSQGKLVQEKLGQGKLGQERQSVADYAWHTPLANQLTAMGSTPLHLACQSASVGVVEWLCKCESTDICMENGSGLSAYRIARGLADSFTTSSSPLQSQTEEIVRSDRTDLSSERFPRRSRQVQSVFWNRRSIVQINVCCDVIQRAERNTATAHPIAVHLMDGSFELMPLTSGANTQVEDAFKTMAERLSLGNSTRALFSVWMCSKSLCLQLRCSHSIIGQLLNWTILLERLCRQNLGHLGANERPKLYLRRSIWATLPINLETEVKFTSGKDGETEEHNRVLMLLFHEAYHHYIEGFYPFSDETVAALAACLLLLFNKTPFDLQKGGAPAKKQLKSILNDPEILKKLVPEVKVKMSKLQSKVWAKIKEIWPEEWGSESTLFEGKRGQRSLLKRSSSPLPSISSSKSVTSEVTGQWGGGLEVRRKMIYLRFLSLCRTCAAYGAAFFDVQLAGEQRYISCPVGSLMKLGINASGLYVVSLGKGLVLSLGFERVNGISCGSFGGEGLLSLRKNAGKKGEKLRIGGRVIKDLLIVSFNKGVNTAINTGVNMGFNSENGKVEGSGEGGRGFTVEFLTNQASLIEDIVKKFALKQLKENV